MKIRTGFVSNSSSSSFMVRFPKNFFWAAENIKAYLFTDWDATTTFDCRWFEDDPDFEIKDGRISLLGMARVIEEAVYGQPLKLQEGDIYLFQVRSDEGGYEGLLRSNGVFKSVPFVEGQ